MAKTTRASAHQMGFILEFPLPPMLLQEAFPSGTGTDTVLLQQEGLPQTFGVWSQPLPLQHNHQSLTETPTSLPKHQRHAAAKTESSEVEQTFTTKEKLKRKLFYSLMMMLYVNKSRDYSMQFHDFFVFVFLLNHVDCKGFVISINNSNWLCIRLNIYNSNKYISKYEYSK